MLGPLGAAEKTAGVMPRLDRVAVIGPGVLGVGGVGVGGGRRRLSEQPNHHCLRTGEARGHDVAVRLESQRVDLRGPAAAAELAQVLAICREGRVGGAGRVDPRDRQLVLAGAVGGRSSEHQLAVWLQRQRAPLGGTVRHVREQGAAAAESRIGVAAVGHAEEQAG